MRSTSLIRRQPQAGQVDLCSAFCSLYIAARGLSTSSIHHSVGGSNNATPNPMHSSPPGTTRRAKPKLDSTISKPGLPSNPAKLTDVERAAATKQRADEAVALAKEQSLQNAGKQGGLARGNIFERQAISAQDANPAEEEEALSSLKGPFKNRSPANMALRLNPNPGARARWMRMMVIRDVRRRGRLTREMRIARTERSHLSKSRFFKTSMKKLAPLARQIAGKTLDEAILQMRFSKKKAAQEVRAHLVQARNEAIVERGMGIPDKSPQRLNVKRSTGSITANVTEMIKQAREKEIHTELKRAKVSGVTQSSPVVKGLELVDPAITPPLPTQRNDKTLKKGLAPNPTDIYIAQAWINRGSYVKEPLPRARGRTDIMRHPHTGISVLLKEEKTRTREKQDKEIRSIRKRLNGKLWTQLPDRPITRQSQYVLW